MLAGAAAVVAAPLTVAPARASTPGASRAAGPRSTDTPFGFVRDRGHYTSFDLPVPSTGETTILSSINARGEIVGKYLDENGTFHGVLRSRQGRYRRIDVPGAMGAYALKINDHGQIVGTWNDANREVTGEGAKGYLLDRGRFTPIVPPGATFSQAWGINNRRWVVGEFIDADGIYHGFLWRNGRYERIDVPGSAGASLVAINDRGAMLGVHGDPGTLSVQGFLLEGGRRTSFDLPDGAVPFVTDLNNRGQIVGTSIGDPADPSTFQGFVLTRGPDGPLTTIKPPGGSASFVGGINDQGQICGVAANLDVAPTATRNPQPMGVMGMGRTG